MAGVLFAIDYPEGGTVNFFHGLAIITGPIALLVTVISRGRAKGRAIAVEMAERDAFTDHAVELAAQGKTTELMSLLEEPETTADEDKRAAVLIALTKPRKGSRFYELRPVDPGHISTLWRLAVDDEAADVRRLAAMALRLTEDDAAGPALIECLEDPDPACRSHGILGLGELQYCPGVESLIKALNTGSTAASAAKSLVLIRDERALPAIEAAAARTWLPLRRLSLKRSAQRLRRSLGLRTG